MKFEAGKYYRHNSERDISIICEAETTVYGKALTAEESDGSLTAVGREEWNAENYTEISREEWMKNFS